MRWEHPTAGSVLWKKRFAFFPKKVQNTTIWLECYYICEYYDTLGWDGQVVKYKYTYLADSKQVKDYLISLSPLARALREDE